MRGAEVATPRSLASSLTWWSFSLCRGGRPSPYIWGTRLCMLKPGACWVNWDELLALLYTSLGPADASSVLRPWGQRSLSPVSLIMCPTDLLRRSQWGPSLQRPIPAWTLLQTGESDVRAGRGRAWGCARLKRAAR